MIPNLANFHVHKINYWDALGLLDRGRVIGYAVKGSNTASTIVDSASFLNMTIQQVAAFDWFSLRLKRNHIFQSVKLTYTEIHDQVHPYLGLKVRITIDES